MDDFTWIDKKKIIGDKCENVIKKYIEAIYKGIEYNHCTLEEAYKGYDFEIKLETPKYIEVKHLGDNNTFHISLNELNKAITYGEEYYIYLVDLDSAKAYIIKNPVKTLNIPVKFLSDTLYSNDYTIFIATSYKVFVKRINSISTCMELSEYI